MAPGALASPLKRPIVFIGFMGAGKSAAAAALDAALGAAPRDSDALLEERFATSIAEVVQTGGEAAFRAAEEEVVLELLGSAGPGSVISLGGGSVLSERVQAALRGSLVTYLDVDPELAWERVGGARGDRPLARDRASFDALHAERAPLYERLADAVIPAGAPAPCGGASAEPRAAEGSPATAPAPGHRAARGVVMRALPALRRLASAECPARMIWATSASAEYPVVLAAGLLADGRPSSGGASEGAGGGRLARLWPLDLDSSRAFCVSDESVAALYRGAVPGGGEAVTIAPGEASKTLACAERLWSELARSGMTRSDHMVALG
ncbi:MAG: hypothetical protein KGJ43_07970, partial [Acidobacteriota bacterium]|nr:hypothetical protein [Acidobacteriota bacterium]